MIRVPLGTARIPIVLPDQTIREGLATSSSLDVIFEPLPTQSNVVPAYSRPCSVIR